MKNEKTHIVNEGGGVLDSLEERSVAGVFKVASVLLKGRFVQPLLPGNKTAVRELTGTQFTAVHHDLYKILHLAVQSFVLLSLHQLRGVPYVAADTLQPIQVLLVLDL